MGPSVLDAAQEKDKASHPGSEFAECANGCPTMVVVPAGRFMMGSPATEKDRAPNEGPQHQVTFAQWDACVAAGGCEAARDSTWGRGNRPAINVTWDDAKRYAAWLPA